MTMLEAMELKLSSPVYQGHSPRRREIAGKEVPSERIMILREVFEKYKAQAVRDFFAQHPRGQEFKNAQDAIQREKRDAEFLLERQRNALEEAERARRVVEADEREGRANAPSGRLAQEGW